MRLGSGCGRGLGEDRHGDVHGDLGRRRRHRRQSVWRRLRLTGDSFTAAFTYDLAKGAYSNGVWSGFGGADPVQSISLRIDGYQMNYAAGLSDVGSLTVQGSTLNQLQVESTIRNIFTGQIVDVSLDTATGVASQVGDVFSGVLPPSACPITCGHFEFGGAVGDFNVTGFSITPFDAAVPEPASWMLAVAGAGLAGAALRRRRPVTAA